MMLTSGSSKQSTNTGFLSRNLDVRKILYFMNSSKANPSEMDLALGIPWEGKGYFGVEGGIRDPTMSRLILS